MMPSTTVTRLQRKTQSVGESGMLLRRRLERRAAGVIDGRVVAEQAHRRDVAAGLEAVGAPCARALPALHRDASMFGVAAASMGVLPPSSFKRFVGGAVGDDDGVFHVCAVSRPETSSVGSASAKPSFCASASACAYVQPLRVMRVRMTLQVPLTMPTSASMRLAIRPR
jgi:hypothetical protein